MAETVLTTGPRRELFKAPTQAKYSTVQCVPLTLSDGTIWRTLSGLTLDPTTAKHVNIDKLR